MFLKSQEKNKILSKKGRSFQDFKKRQCSRKLWGHNIMTKLVDCQRGIVTKYFKQLSCLSRVAGCSFKGKSRFKSSKSSHRCSNANAKFQFIFWNTTGSFSFEANRQPILYFTIQTYVHVILQSSVICKNMFFIITRYERGSQFSYVF